MPKINNIVLVHGGFVDGAGWRGVYDILKNDGSNVSIVQNPTISLAGDVSATKLISNECHAADCRQPRLRRSSTARLCRGGRPGKRQGQVIRESEKQSRAGQARASVHGGDSDGRA